MREESKMGDPTVKTWESIVIQFVLVLIVIIVSVVGNTAIGALLIRFKKLRTVPNLLIANLALVDLLNALVNMPLYILYDVLPMHSSMSGKAITFTVSTLHTLFLLLGLFMTAVIAADRYGAMVYGLKYMTWKTPQKACIAVALAWILSGACTMLNFIPFRRLDIPNGKVIDYRKALFRSTGRVFLLTAICVTMAVTCILSVMTRRVILRARKEVRRFYWRLNFTSVFY